MTVIKYDNSCNRVSNKYPRDKHRKTAVRQRGFSFLSFFKLLFPDFGDKLIVATNKNVDRKKGRRILM